MFGNSLIQNPVEPGESGDQQILLKISQSIISTLDYQHVLQIISDGMSELLEIETAAIYLIEDKDHLYLGATTPPLPPEMPDSLRYISLDKHLHIRKTLETRQPVVVPDMLNATLTQAEKDVMEMRNLRSLLFLPFIQEERVLGVLILGTSNKTRQFSEREINLGQTVANQLSIGIQNARLHQNLQEKNKALMEEIHERRKVEEALRKSEVHLSNALRIAKLGHWEYDVADDMYTFTDEFYALYKTSVEEMKGYRMSAGDYAEKFFHQSDQPLVRQSIAKTMSTPEDKLSKVVEHKVRFPNGETGYIMVRYQNLRDENGNIIKIIGVNQDVTYQKLVEAELRQHRDNLEELVREKTKLLDHTVEELQAANEELSGKNTIINDQNAELKGAIQELQETQARLIQSEKMASLGILTAGVAHEINNPLNYIMGAYLALESCQEEGSIEPEILGKAMFTLKTGLDRATEIVKGLNQFSRENRALDEACNLHEILDNCLTMLNSKLESRIVIEKNYRAEKPVVRGNVGQLHQALMNVLLNGIQAIEGQGKILVSTSRSGEEIVVAIDDTGNGIPRENLDKILDPFFTTKDPGKGTGLGLSITYSIIREHSGTIDFESSPGKGTRVIISIPEKLKV